MYFTTDVANFFFSILKTFESWILLSLKRHFQNLRTKMLVINIKIIKLLVLQFSKILFVQTMLVSFNRVQIFLLQSEVQFIY